jgi:hypothetical protein
MLRIVGRIAERIKNTRKALTIMRPKFEERAPDPQNAIDIFAERWASDLSDLAPGVRSGPVRLFTTDQRPHDAMSALAAGAEPEKLRVLELGPLEGAHTYQLEKLGVREVIAIEANVEAFLKCLIVKNLAGLRSRFLLGDFVEYLKDDSSRYDLIFCSGVLYHMQDPVQLIELMAAHTDRIFVWTHYIVEHSTQSMHEVTRGGQRYIYHQRIYEDRDYGRFWGGNKPTASLLARDDILRAFAANGFDNHKIHAEDLSHPGGPCFSVSLWRSRADR